MKHAYAGFLLFRRFYESVRDRDRTVFDLTDVKGQADHLVFAANWRRCNRKNKWTVYDLYCRE